jgi:site-specific recombinase XerD
VLLSEAFDRYRRDVVMFKNQSRRTDEQVVTARNSLLKYVGEDERKSQGTVRQYILKLRVVLAYMMRLKEDCLDYQTIPVPKREITVPTYIEPEEVQKLIDCAKHTRAKAIISLLYASGIRVSELCQLNRDQLKNGRFTVVGKGSKPRLCFYDERTAVLLHKYLRTRRDNHPALFVQRTSLQRLNKDGVSEIFRCVRRTACFDKPITPHTMRHSYATNLAQQGIPIHSLQRLLGHSSLQTTSLYLHVSDIRLQEEYAKYHKV